MLHIQQIARYTGHRAALYALAPGRDDRHFLSAGGDGWITEWDIDAPEAGRVVANIETQVFSLCALDDPDRIVAGNMTGGLHWITRSKPDSTRNVQHHKNKGVYALRQHGEYVFSAGGDGVLTRWSAAAGHALESIQLSNQALRCMDISAQRREIAVGASDHSLYLLDLDTFAVKKILPKAHGNSVFAVAYAPDGQHLLTGGRDAMLRVWDISSDLALVKEQAAHWFTLNHLVFSPDGTLFATASRDKTIKIWDAQDFNLLKVLDVQRFGSHANSVNQLLWLPEGLLSCSDDRSVLRWFVKRA